MMHKYSVDVEMVHKCCRDVEVVYKWCRNGVQMLYRYRIDV